MKSISWKYCSALFLLIGCQIVWTLNSTSQIRYEEVAESIRNVFWLQNQAIYDGFSSNVGWYGTLLVIYKLFGFSLFTAKFYRLFLFIISIVCLSLTLKKYLGEKNSIIPLITIGLSPTFLYFNTFQTSYGMDIQYLLICIFLLDKSVFKFTFQNIICHILLWLISMIAWMSYPVYIFYLPALGIIYVTKLFKSATNFSTKIVFIFASLISFLLPLIISFIYVKNRSLLWYDEKLMSGIFRGAGSILFDLPNWIKNINGLLADILYKGNSYNFEIFKGEFSDYYPIGAILIILLLSIYFLVKRAESRFLLVCIWFTLILSIFIANSTMDPTLMPGIRRNTASLAAFYSLFVMTWLYVSTYSKQGFKKNIILVILCLIPLHHFLVFPANLSHFSDPSIFQYGGLMGASTPPESLNYYTKQAQNQELSLSCHDNTDKLFACRYSEIYAAVAGDCLWNNLKCQQILGYDNKTQSYIPLNISLWENYYFDH